MSYSEPKPTPSSSSEYQSLVETSPRSELCANIIGGILETLSKRVNLVECITASSSVTLQVPFRVPREYLEMDADLVYQIFTEVLAEYPTEFVMKLVCIRSKSKSYPYLHGPLLATIIVRM